MNSSKLTHFENVGQIRWACRRGMLELDVLLSKFFEDHYLLLNESNKKLFCQLLQCEDNQLFKWFFGSGYPIENKYADLIEQIKS